MVISFGLLLVISITCLLQLTKQILTLALISIVCLIKSRCRIRASLFLPWVLIALLRVYQILCLSILYSLLLCERVLIILLRVD